MVLKIVAVLVLACGIALADPAGDLRLANNAAAAGDWARVQVLCDPLVLANIAETDRAEANRLEGLAAFFTKRSNPDPYFLAYLRHDLDGHLDPALYPPEVVNYFNELRARHAAELDALRPRVKKRYWQLAAIPVASQIQNDEMTKGIVIASLLGGLLAANITTYAILDSWCGGNDHTCDGDGTGTNHAHGASAMRTINVVTGVGAILTVVYGMYDGVRGYRRAAITPYISSSETSAALGFSGRF
ncbi:MAG TPA: hypothetical protein VGC41_16910 [Kofleriaceae bacterium]